MNVRETFGYILEQRFELWFGAVTDGQTVVVLWMIEGTQHEQHLET